MKKLSLNINLEGIDLDGDSKKLTKQGVIDRLITNLLNAYSNQKRHFSSLY